MRDICACVVVLSSTFFGLCYVRRIYRKKAEPTISTWIIFLVGCMLSFVTYGFAQEWDIKSGVLNTTDLIYVAGILLAILLCGGQKGRPRFKPFEKWYLALAGGIVVYGLATGDAWSSNVLTQVLMSLAYFPIFHKMLEEKEKKDSYFAWLPAAVNALVALYPAIDGGNALSVIYAVRAFSFSLATCLMMAYYQFIRPPRYEFFW